MRTARIHHQVSLERAGLSVVTSENVDPGAVALRLSRGPQRGHLGALEKSHVLEFPAQLEDGALDEWTARVQLPQSGVAAPTPPVWPQCRDVPAGFHRHRSALPHSALEAREEALELTKATRQQIVHVASLRDAWSKLVG